MPRNRIAPPVLAAVLSLPGAASASPPAHPEGKAIRVPPDAGRGGPCPTCRSTGAALGNSPRIAFYEYAVRIDPQARSLTGEARLLVARDGTEPEIALDLVGLDVQGATVDGEEVAFVRTEEQVIVPLPVDGDSFEVGISYGGTPSTTPEGRGLNFTQSMVYSFVEPDGARRWLPLVDLPDRKAPLRLSTTLPSSYVVVGNGLLESDVPAEAGWHTVTWATDFPIAPYLISMTAAPFQVVEDEWNGIPVSYWAPASLIEDAAYDLGRTPEMMGVFSDLFFPYPFEKYGTATAPISGAMEHQTATTYGTGLIDGTRWSEYIVAHELMHHWWGDWVTCATWDDIWLNEGFASFGEALWAEAQGGPDAYRAYVRDQVGSYLAWTEFEGTFPIARPDYMWGGTVYDKGSAILAMLRDELGDEVFFEVLRAWGDAFAMGAGTTQDFQGLVQAVSERDVGVFFDQWIWGPGHPSLDWSWRRTPLADGRTQVDVAVSQVQDVETVFQLSLDVGVSPASGGPGQVTSVRVDAAQQVFSLCLDQEPGDVDLDPEGRVVHEQRLLADPGAAFVAACGADAAGDPVPGDDDVEDPSGDPPPPVTTGAVELVPAGCACATSAPPGGSDFGLAALLLGAARLRRRS